jgi:hypothetical protein
MGGSIATYATNAATPAIPFWPMVFKNTQLFFLGSDDFRPEVNVAAARDINAALEAGWSGFAIGERIPLPEIARTHELAEHLAPVYEIQRGICAKAASELVLRGLGLYRSPSEN